MSLLELFREVTGPSHDALDSAFSSLDLSDRGGLHHFLCAHYVGMQRLYGPFAEFTARALDREAPDYPAMLRRDLADIGVDAASLPVLDTASRSLSPEGVAYVVTGSRLGMTVIRKQDIWSPQAGTVSRYMADDEGLALWRALSSYLKNRPGSGEAASESAASALAAFDIFREAFAACTIAPA